MYLKILPNECYHRQRWFCVCERKIPYMIIIEFAVVRIRCAIEQGQNINASKRRVQHDEH